MNFISYFLTWLTKSLYHLKQSTYVPQFNTNPVVFPRSIFDVYMQQNDR